MHGLRSCSMVRARQQKGGAFPGEAAACIVNVSCSSGSLVAPWPCLGFLQASAMPHGTRLGRAATVLTPASNWSFCICTHLCPSPGHYGVDATSSEGSGGGGQGAPRLSTVAVENKTRQNARHNACALVKLGVLPWLAVSIRQLIYGGRTGRAGEGDIIMVAAVVIWPVGSQRIRAVAVIFSCA